MGGMTAGAGIGAAVGVVPAIFTFGLSIPVCAFVGGAVGVCADTVVGGSTGLVGGGADGHYGYKHRDEIKSAAKCVSDKANACTNALKQRASETKKYTMQRVSETKDYTMQRVSETKEYTKQRLSKTKEYTMQRASESNIINFVSCTGGTKEKAL